jgi:hypothetical protein
VRSKGGEITVFDAPGAGTAFGQGTFANEISASGAITGYFLDSTFAMHGFIRIP